MKSKLCPSCHLEKPATQFGVNGGRKDNLYPYCKLCSHQKAKINYPKYREQALMYKNSIKRKVLTHYGNEKLACVKCGFSDLRALSIDHIEGGGLKHRREIGMQSGSAFYCWLIRNGYPEGYQTLCMNCQYIKRATNREV